MSEKTYTFAMDDKELMEAVVGDAVVRVPITNQEIAYVLEGAFEGGSTYWIEDIESVGERNPLYHMWSDEVVTGGTIKIMPEDREYIATITKLDILRGISMAFEQGLIRDLYDMDANDADNILQLAMWGEVIFG